MFDIMTCFASEAAPLKLNDLPIGERKKIISKSVEKIPTDKLAKLCQVTGDKFVTMHEGAIPGTPEGLNSLHNAYNFFTKSLSKRQPTAGVQADAMGTYLKELSERVAEAAEAVPHLAKATDVSKYLKGNVEYNMGSTDPADIVANFVKNVGTGVKITTEHLEKQTQKIAQYILDGLESKGISTNQIVKTLTESGLSDAEKYVKYLKRVR